MTYIRLVPFQTLNYTTKFINIKNHRSWVHTINKTPRSSRSSKNMMILCSLLGLSTIGLYCQVTSVDSKLHKWVTMPLLLSLDPETAHKFSIKAALLNLFPQDKENDDERLRIRVSVVIKNDFLMT